jgi:hypothetical protein
MRKLFPILACMAVFGAATLFGSAFPRIVTETADGNKFVFPDDATDAGPVLFALAVGSSRKDGEEQQRQLLEWQRYFDEHPSLLGPVAAYHVPVIGKVPFFVKGAIRKGMGNAYGEYTDKARIVVLFVKDVASFAEASGFELDGRPTLVLTDRDGAIAGILKGELSDRNAERLQEMLASL